MFVMASRIGREPGAIEWACVNSTSIDIAIVTLLVVLLVEKELICAYRGETSGPQRHAFDVVILPLIVIFMLIIVRSLLELMQVAA